MTNLRDRRITGGLVLVLLGIFALYAPTSSLIERAASRKAQAQTGPPCYANEQLPSNFLPFSQLYYVTGPNAVGDYLAVGRTTIQQLAAFPLASAVNQQYCRPLRLAATLTATTYVTTPNERNGDFTPFSGLLIDPLANFPFPGGVIPANRLGNPFAFRIRPDALSTVSAASYRGASLAREAIATAFGTGLATATQAATTTPLPTALAGTTVMVKDRLQMQRAAPLFFVAPNQINYQIPPGTADGAATVIVLSDNGAVAASTVPIAPIAPGLFAANADGQGVAAAVALRIKADGTQTFEPAVRFEAAQNRFIPVPLDLGAENEQVFALLFGTGLRFRTALSAANARIGGTEAPVTFVGAQGELVGLDQINIRLPRTLAGRGLVDVALVVDTVAANVVQISIR